MTLHIETGHQVTADVERLGTTTVRFVTEDGRTMFEVSAGKDGRSIKVRGVEMAKVDGVICGGTIDIRPRAANGVDVLASRYDDE